MRCSQRAALGGTEGALGEEVGDPMFRVRPGRQAGGQPTDRPDCALYYSLA